MKNVLIIANSNDYSYSLLPHFLKYKIEEGEEKVYQPYYIGNVDKSTISGIFNFLYNGIRITFKFSKNLNYSKSSIKENIDKEYDKIFVLKEYNSRELNTHSFDNVEILHFKVDENFHDTDEYVKNFLSEFRIISSASLSFENKNFYFEPIINLFTFYYTFGFNYLSYSKLNVYKNNLIGMYYIKNYKNGRDFTYNIISDIFKKHEVNGLTIYDTNLNKPQIILKYLEQNNGNWGLNHSAMYSDYISSVCGFIFDTLNHSAVEGPADATGRHYINEKSLKAILFSKLNIPFIIDTNPYNFHLLNDLGFWFLNSEFYNFDKNKSEENMILETRQSIISAAEYLIELYKKNNFDLNKTHTELVYLYGDKMQNNYSTFMKYLESPKNGDKLIDFILYGKRS